MAKRRCLQPEAREGRRDRPRGRGLRRRGEGAALLRGGEGAARVAARRHGQDARARRGPRLDAEALQAEGHRPRASRLDPRAAATSAAARRTRPQPRRLARTARRARCASARSAARSRSSSRKGRLIVVDSFELAEIKTKALAGVLDDAAGRTKAAGRRRQGNENLRLSIRNLPKITSSCRPRASTSTTCSATTHLVLSKDAAKALEARCLKKR